jgi:hypothetical protein
MEALEKILQKIADGVNWPVIFYVLFGLLVLWILVRWLHLSPVHIAIDVLKEITSVLARRDVTRTSIDGAVTIAMILFTAVTLLVVEMRELPEFLSIFRAGAETEGQPIFLVAFMIFMTSLTAILSLLVTR